MLALLVALFAAVHADVSPSAYVLVEGNQVTSTGCGELSDLRDAYGSHFFWFRHDGGSYVVRDAAALRAIDELFRRQRELGNQQAVLGSKQAALGSEQAEYGSRQSRLGAEQSRLSERVAYDPDARLRMRELGDQMRELGGRMRLLGDRMRSLGGDMRVLGDQMREEGRVIDRRLRAMIPDLIARGIAREVQP